jgi:Molecular chaperone GrpE (heat shock protein)
MAAETNDEKPKGFTINDRRFWLQEDFDLTKVPDQPSSSKPSFVEDLEKRLEEKDKLLREYIQAHKASVADLDNARARIERELSVRLEIERARLAEPFLEVLDNLTRLRDHCRQEPSPLSEGLELIWKQLGEQLKKLGIQPIPTNGERFQPKTMEAMATTPVDEAQDGMVLEEYRRGYTIAERVIRPAGVRVGVRSQG